MTEHKMQLADWLDDLCVRFIINLPNEELTSVERICFQIEEAQWFYEDFIRPLDPQLPSMNLRRFCMAIFKHCPLSANFPQELHELAYEQFLEYKTRVPVRGAIMLNQDMTHAVLVKGWKKGAKWSFPRGKINKDEPDLNCAVREVYEETGYDLRETGLVGEESQMKFFKIGMRDQEMMLYVFRGVPMDTHFEPRTRKEISKIDWYKLTDLPTLKRKNHGREATGQDAIKENNFYMVAPFIGPLKGWIKQQGRLDKQRAKAGGHAVPVAAGATDTEEVEADLGDTTADEALILETQLDDGSFADLVAQLKRGHRASDALPEVSAEQPIDPAEALKNLLGVRDGSSLQASAVEAPALSYEPPANPLLAMFQQGNSNPPVPLPRTPFDQFISPPVQPHSPHGQHHPRLPHLDHRPPPPLFPFAPQHLPPRASQHLHMAPQHNNGIPAHIPPHFMPPPPHQPNPVFPAHTPNIQQAFSQQIPPSYQQSGHSSLVQPQFPGVHGPGMPSAPKPPPELTAHKLGLLNAFKAHEKPIPPPQSQFPPSEAGQATPRMQEPPVPHRGLDSFVSPPELVSPPPFQSQPPSLNFQPAQPKPQSAQQAALLNIFRSTLVSAGTPSPPKELEPAELSAMPLTPGHDKMKSSPQGIRPPKPDLTIKPDLLALFGQQPVKPELTSATVTGPVNVPDFETVKKNAHSDANGHSRGPSPAPRKSTEQKMFVPQQILRRESMTNLGPTELPHRSRTASPKTMTSNVTTPQAKFKPKILKRPQQNASPVPATASASNPLLALLGSQASPPQAPLAPSRSPAIPSAQPAFDRRESAAADQKAKLLSMFQQPSQPAASPIQPSTSPVPPRGLVQPPPGLASPPSRSPMPKSPIAPAKSPQPPTPRSVISGVTSPVSPLPAQSSQQNSPANLASRSRISSLGDVIPPNIIIPEQPNVTSHPLTAIQNQNGNGNGVREAGYTSTGATSVEDLLGTLVKGKEKARSEEKSPTAETDKSFLLSYLNNYAKGSR